MSYKVSYRVVLAAAVKATVALLSPYTELVMLGAGLWRDTAEGDSAGSLNTLLVTVEAPAAGPPPRAGG